jgi:very-short-patch-repair endonuclease
MEHKIENWLEKRGNEIKEEWIDVVKDKIIQCQSPIEKLFLIEWEYQNNSFYFGGDLKDYYIKPQFIIEGYGYKVDFMIINTTRPDWIVVELDSYLWHGSTPDQFAKEKERERDITKLGYKLFRFSGKEIYRNVEKCVNETIKYCLDQEK